MGYWCFIINSSLTTIIRAWSQHNASKWICQISWCQHSIRQIHFLGTVLTPCTHHRYEWWLLLIKHLFAAECYYCQHPNGWWHPCTQHPFLEPFPQIPLPTRTRALEHECTQVHQVTRAWGLGRGGQPLSIGRKVLNSVKKWVIKDSNPCSQKPSPPSLVS